MAREGRYPAPRDLRSIDKGSCRRMDLFFNSFSLFFHFYLNDFSKELREARNLYADKSVDIRSKEIF